MVESTGYFKDGLRRIDIILVIEDGTYEEKIDKIKIDFLINIIKIGLEVEVESGVMKDHEKLVFVKVHAPDAVIEEYGNYYNVRKHLKETHIEFINPDLNVFGIKTEKELIKSIRRHYHGYTGPKHYSNVERSTIVYHILLSLPFGKHENYVGLQRLIERNIIVDAYALHDGPYFFVRNRFQSKFSCRQVLFYNWVGKINIFKRQPVHLIREYLGEKVAFYFAFFEYFNISLIFASIKGFFVTVKGLYNVLDDDTVKEACFNNDTDASSKFICPLCRDFNSCPFRNLTDFCAKVVIANFIDNPWTMIDCILISFCAMVFVLLWRRRKNYLSWLWEYDTTDSRKVVRSEFNTDIKNVKASKITGVMTDTENIKIKVLRLVLTVCSLLVWMLFMETLTMSLFILKYQLSSEFSKINNMWRDYLAVITITCLNVFVVTMLQKLSRIMAYQLTRSENHKTINSFETFFITKLFGFSFVCNFSLLISYHFLNLLYTYPSDKYRWYLIGGIGMMNCGPESCLDELCVTLVVTILVQEYVMKLPAFLFETKTDYTPRNSNAPCWEREYLLKPLTDYELFEKFNNLGMLLSVVLKFTLVGLFSTAFPLTPLLVLISGICNIRYEARQFLISSRRPLLRQPSSQNFWYKMMLTVVYAVPCFNTIALTWTTTMLHYTRTDYQSSFFTFSMGRFVTEDYKKITGSGSPAEAFSKYKGFVPTECLFPGLRFRSKNFDGEYYAVERFWRIRYDKHLLMLEVEHLALLLMILLHCVIPAYPRDIMDTMAIEERIIRRATYIKNK